MTRFSQQIIVNKHQSAAEIGSGLLEVFSTPSMIALMENTAMQLIPLKEGESSVGTSIHAEHLKASPIGAKLTFTAELTANEGRKYNFNIEVSDESGNLVGKALHTRFVVDIARFMSKVQ
jgi:predicted thioesterase